MLLTIGMFIVAFHTQAIGSTGSSSYDLQRSDGTFPWVAKPTVADSERITPPTVDRRGTEQVLMSCELAMDGALTNCEVDLESREGIGLGEAALDAASLTKIEPTLPSGMSVVGLHADVVMIFALGNEGYIINPIILGAALYAKPNGPMIDGNNSGRPAPVIINGD